MRIILSEDELIELVSVKFTSMKLGDISNVQIETDDESGSIIASCNIGGKTKKSTAKKSINRKPAVKKSNNTPTEEAVTNIKKDGNSIIAEPEPEPEPSVINTDKPVMQSMVDISEGIL